MYMNTFAIPIYDDTAIGDVHEFANNQTPIFILESKIYFIAFNTIEMGFNCVNRMRYEWNCSNSDEKLLLLEILRGCRSSGRWSTTLMMTSLSYTLEVEVLLCGAHA